MLIGHAETHVSFLTFDLNKDFDDGDGSPVLWGAGEEVCYGCACMLHSERLTVLSVTDYIINMENSNRFMRIIELWLTTK